jgi:hypothetical protein
MARYWEGNNLIGRLLRFLNVIEPGRDLVLSMSKIFLWTAIALFGYICVRHPDNLAAMAGATVTMAGALGNYGYRRRKMYQAGKDPYAEDDQHDATKGN